MGLEESGGGNVAVWRLLAGSSRLSSAVLAVLALAERAGVQEPQQLEGLVGGRKSCLHC